MDRTLSLLSQNVPVISRRTYFIPEEPIPTSVKLLMALSPLPGTPFPKNFLPVVKKILSRLFRVFVHVYIHHFDRITQMGSEAHVNTCYKHFYYFVKEFNLIDTKELEPLVSLGVSAEGVGWGWRCHGCPLKSHCWNRGRGSASQFGSQEDGSWDVQVELSRVIWASAGGR